MALSKLERCHAFVSELLLLLLGHLPSSFCSCEGNWSFDLTALKIPRALSIQWPSWRSRCAFRGTWPVFSVLHLVNLGLIALRSTRKSSDVLLSMASFPFTPFLPGFRFQVCETFPLRFVSHSFPYSTFFFCQRFSFDTLC